MSPSLCRRPRLSSSLCHCLICFVFAPSSCLSARCSPKPQCRAPSAAHTRRLVSSRGQRRIPSPLSTLHGGPSGGPRLSGNSCSASPWQQHRHGRQRHGRQRQRGLHGGEGHRGMGMCRHNCVGAWGGGGWGTPGLSEDGGGTLPPGPMGSLFGGAVAQLCQGTVCGQGQLGERCRGL